MFHGIHHIAIICSNYEVSRHFYVNTLGLAVVSESYRRERNSYKLNLRLPDGSEIELFSFPNPPVRLTRPEACGLRHLALVVGDLRGSVAALAARGVTTEEPRIDDLTGALFTFFNDPDGLPIEICEVSERRGVR